MALFLLILCVTTWSLNLAGSVNNNVPLHGPSPALGSGKSVGPSGRSVKATTGMPMKMMIDMRGFPDLEGNCFRGEGFYRNKTDCTQFYRCVDYFKKQRYTFYRFMCGPMTVFDESRSLCTGPDMAVPRCNETTPTFSTEKPVTDTTTLPTTTTTPDPFINPCGLSGKCTETPATTVDTTTTTTTESTTTALDPVTTPTTTTSEPVTSTTPEFTSPDSVTSSSTLNTPIVMSTDSSVSSTTAEVTDASTADVGGSTTTTTTTESTVTTTASEVPSVDVTSSTAQSVTQTESTPEVATQTESTTTTTTEGSVETVTQTESTTTSVVTESTPGGVTQTESTTATTTGGSVETGTQTESTTEAAPSTESSTITTTTTEGAATDPQITEGTSTPSDNVTPSTSAVTQTDSTITTTETGSTSTTTTESTVDVTSPSSTIGVVTPTEGSSTQPPVTINDNKLITATDAGDNQSTPELAFISSDNPYGVLIQKDTVITLDGTSLTIPSSSILVFESNQEGGSVTNVINGLTSSSTVANLPQGTKVFIYKVNSKGEVISKVQVFVTQSISSTFNLPAQSSIGYLQISSQNKLYSIGQWVYSYAYITYQSQITYYQVISSIKTTTVSLQTQSQSVSGNGQFISGIMTVGGSISSQTEQSLSEITVTGNQQLALIPPGGNGTITISEESGEITQFDLMPGMMMTVSVQSAGSSGSVTNLNQQFFTSSTSQLKFTSGCVISIVRVTTSGKLETVSSYTLKTSSTIQTAVQSSVGVLSFSQEQIKMIGQASFTVQELVNPSEKVFMGVVNLNNVVSTSTVAPPTTEVTTTPTTTTPSSGQSGNLQIIDIPCPVTDPNDFSKFALHEYPYDCSKFTQCLRQEGQDVQFFVFPCAEGLYFNSQTLKCDKKENVQCDVGALNSTAGGGVFGIQCTGEMYRYPINCQAFYQCIADDSNVDSVTMFLYSCADGLVFDESKRSCLTPSETGSCEEQLFRDYEFDAAIDSSFIYRLSQELHAKTGFVKRIEGRSNDSFHPHHAGRGAAGKRVMIRMSASGINGRLHVADYPENN